MRRSAWIRQCIFLDEEHFRRSRPSVPEGTQGAIFRECGDIQRDRLHPEPEGSTKRRIRLVSQLHSSLACLRRVHSGIRKQTHFTQYDCFQNATPWDQWEKTFECSDEPLARLSSLVVVVLPTRCVKLVELFQVI